jgi:large subunit ribosomal protein L34
MKPTYNPSKLRRARKFGFRKRNQTSAGRKVLQNRRRKGRAKLPLLFFLGFDNAWKG